MPATITESNSGIQQNEAEEPRHEDKPSRKGNPFIKGLTRNMITEPYVLDFADGMNSAEFAWEKVSKQVLEPLGITTEKEWLDFCKSVWRWHSVKEVREAESTADRILAEIDPLTLDILKKKIGQNHKAA